MMAMLYLLPLLLTLTYQFTSGVYASATFTLVNKCGYTIWPGILSGAGIAPLSTTGFALQQGESRSIQAPSSWGGRFWGRTHCGEDSTGKFSCITGDCGSEKVECAGGNAAPPATLAEFKLDGDGGKDFYDVSLVDGYNLPMLVVPKGGSGVNCTNTGCVMDLNGGCPSALKVTTTGGEGVACKSACEAFKQDQYCCSGAFGNPNTCKPSSYAKVFKNACPQAYSFAYDDKTSTFTCSGADYTITFCPSRSASQKSSNGSPNQVPQEDDDDDNNNSNFPPINSAMVYEGALDESSAASMGIHMLGTQIIAGTVAILASTWRLCRYS